MLDRTVNSTMAPYRDQSTCSTRGGARGKLTACDDDELSNWLMECIEDGSENFLCAVAEAAIAANAEDYLVIRPALLALKRKHKAKRAI